MTAQIETTNGTRRGWNIAVMGGLLAIAVAFLHWRTFAGLVFVWWTDQDYAYGFLVPPMAFLLLYLRRKDFSKIRYAPSANGFWLIALSALMHWRGIGGEVVYMQELALIVLLMGIVLTLGGKELLRLTAFPIIFLAFMAPLPSHIHNRIANPLKTIATIGSTIMLEILGVPVRRDGNIIVLPEWRLDVADACSGIRSLMGLFAMGVLLGYLVTPRRWERFTLAFATIPLAVIANVFRITGTGLIYQYGNPKHAQGFLHGFGALIIYIFSLTVLFLLSAGLAKLFPHKEEDRPASKAPDLPTPVDFRRRTLFVPCLAAIIVAGVALNAYQFMLEKRSGGAIKVLAVPLKNFPRQMGDWRGEKVELDPIIRKILSPDDAWNAQYSKPRQDVSCGIYYFRNASLTRGHDPRVCYPANGWKPEKQDLITLKARGLKPGALVVNRGVYSRDGRQSLVLHWYHSPHGPSPDALSVKWRRLVYFWEDMADRSQIKVQLAFPINDDLGATMESAQEFAALVVSSLEVHLGPRWILPLEDQYPGGTN